LDIGFIVADLAFIAEEGLTLTNGVALLLDVGGALIPFVTGGGQAVRPLLQGAVYLKI